MEFAIVIEKTQALLDVSQEFEHKLELARGSMVEIRYPQHNQSIVVIHDFHQKNLAFENNLYIVKNSALLRVPERIWPYLVAITDPNERANIAKDQYYVEYILTLKEKSFVRVNGQYFSAYPIRQQFLPEREPKYKSLDYDCIVRYIGPVDEIGPGYFFALELLVNAFKSYYIFFSLYLKNLYLYCL
jgi:hypothetical protein